MPAPLPPHPVLSQYYRSAEEREAFVRGIFDETAEWYDDIIGMLSFGSGNRYRRQALERAGIVGGKKLLDLATGTGVVARAARILGNRVIGADASFGMLLAGRGKSDVPLIQTRGEALPCRSESVDAVSVGYALRHFADLNTLFTELHRVLRPGGTVLILEITPPPSAFGRAMLRFHLNRVVPLLARLRSRSESARKLMHYYWDTIESCVPPESILSAMRAAGFREVDRHVELGTFSEYRGVR